ncbi:hypothetical protein [Nitrosospira sp. Is2]|uniref:hypothetical protein n=1 Tax=Nitrosospira sp. Is2 TaxID=3080532 RepID=UPI002952A083|nr:hypothetical protein [Nitrosospira sp. Is2]WON74187.1 hypothetical protein R5L00_01470 [Nitrosospira sp. Is2]
MALPWRDIIGRAIVMQRLEVLADMGAKRISVVARRFRLFKPAAHCCYFAIAKVEWEKSRPIVRAGLL